MDKHVIVAIAEIERLRESLVLEKQAATVGEIVAVASIGVSVECSCQIMHYVDEPVVDFAT